jgi:hypothetical protein
VLLPAEGEPRSHEPPVGRRFFECWRCCEAGGGSGLRGPGSEEPLAVSRCARVLVRAQRDRGDERLGAKGS